MSFKIEICFVFLALVSQLFFFAYAAAEPLETTDDALNQDTLLPTLVAEKNRRTLVSFFPVIIEGEPAGVVAVYDDPTTDRAADYWELYNNEGELAAASWFDQFGIVRMAVDRGVLEETGELEGVFVVFLQGESL
jgi:hypothetical protein